MININVPFAPPDDAPEDPSARLRPGFVTMESETEGRDRLIRPFYDPDPLLFGRKKSLGAVQEQCRRRDQIAERKSLVFHNFAHSEMLGKVGTLEAELKLFDQNE